MIHLGDIGKIKDAPAVDCVVGGSPCQDLSVAGLRAGLEGNRSGLFREMVRVIKEMRERDAQSGRTGDMARPRFVVWENVVGAYSSNGGKDFAEVLNLFVRIAQPEAPDVPVPDKWPLFGGMRDMDGRWSLAWRTHDAQYWGVPQRRRRIALVADFGGQSAPEILFERNGLCWDSAQSGEARKGAAGDVENCAYPSIARSLTARNDGSPCIDRGPDVVMQLFEPKSAFEENWAESDVKNALRAEASKSSHVICIDLPAVFDARGNGNGAVSPTMTGDHRSRVTDYTAICIGNGQAHIASHITEDVCQTLNCMHDQMAIMTAAVDCRNGTENPDVNGTPQAKEQGQNLNSNNVVRSNMTVRRLTPLECERLQGYPDGWTDIPPMECDINFWRPVWDTWDDICGHKHHSDKQIVKWLKSAPTDGARYKAMGNSIALPFWQHLFSRMVPYLGDRPTLGSLFDGVGGFPLCWSRCGGTTLWASEIEPFPVRVTKYREEMFG